MLTGEWKIIDHMINLRIGNTELLVDNGMTMREAFHVLFINADDKDFETTQHGQPEGD